MKRFFISYYDGDGETFGWFNSKEDIDIFIDQQEIDVGDISEILEVTVDNILFDKSKLV